MFGSPTQAQPQGCDAIRRLGETIRSQACGIARKFPFLAWRFWPSMAEACSVLACRQQHSRTNRLLRAKSSLFLTPRRRADDSPSTRCGFSAFLPPAKSPGSSASWQMRWQEGDWRWQPVVASVPIPCSRHHGLPSTSSTKEP